MKAGGGGGGGGVNMWEVWYLSIGWMINQISKIIRINAKNA